MGNNTLCFPAAIRVHELSDVGLRPPTSLRKAGSGSAGLKYSVHEGPLYADDLSLFISSTDAHQHVSLIWPNESKFVASSPFPIPQMAAAVDKKRKMLFSLSDKNP